MLEFRLPCCRAPDIPSLRDLIEEEPRWIETDWESIYSIRTSTDEVLWPIVLHYLPRQFNPTRHSELCERMPQMGVHRVG